MSQKWSRSSPSWSYERFPLKKMVISSPGSMETSKKVDQTLQVSGGVTHSHLQLSMDDIALLETSDQRDLLRILTTMDERKNPPQLIDAEVIENG